MSEEEKLKELLVNIKQAKETKGLSYSQLSNLTGYGASYINDIFHGSKPLTFKTLFAICKALDLQIKITVEPS